MVRALDEEKEQNGSSRLTAVLVAIAAALLVGAVLIAVSLDWNFGNVPDGGLNEADVQGSGAAEAGTQSDASEGSVSVEQPDLSTLDITDPLFPKADYARHITFIDQYPELPTGCESVALTTVLQAMGFKLSKTVIADHFLDYSDENFLDDFVGDPHSYEGMGAYPPAIVNAANRFLISRSSKARAYNISGSAWGDLLEYVDKGYPVMVWSTIDGYEPLFTDVYAEGWPWYENEHCVVLYAVDHEQGTVSVCDPTNGDVQYGADEFAQLYKACLSMAVVIY
ncbi:MAG: C39 family peptidase [Eggerthellaceae bacterium]|nr:C39 family peptidase [Eggerthellaceae bacterium]